MLALAVGRAVPDPRLSPVAGRPSDTWSDTDACDDGDDGDRSTHRQTLRQILMLGIEDRVHFGQGVNGYREPDDGGVLLTLADGATRWTDALVGADGVNSAIRRLRLPHATPADTGSACIYGKTPLDAALDSRLTSATSVISARTTPSSWTRCDSAFRPRPAR